MAEFGQCCSILRMFGCLCAVQQQSLAAVSVWKYRRRWISEFQTCQDFVDIGHDLGAQECLEMCLGEICST